MLNSVLISPYLNDFNHSTSSTTTLGEGRRDKLLSLIGASTFLGAISSRFTPAAKRRLSTAAVSLAVAKPYVYEIC